MARLRQQVYWMPTLLLVCFLVCVIGDTFYACRAVNYIRFPYYTITCPINTVINVQSAVIGAAGASGRYIAPSANNTDGECPWTAFTNATCALVSPGCPACQCTCVRSLPVPPDCNERECNFAKSNLIFPDSNPFCVVSRDADFIVVNYTCNSAPTESVRTTVTTLILTSSTSRSASTVSYVAPPSYSSTVPVSPSAEGNVTATTERSGATGATDCEIKCEYETVKKTAIGVGVIAIVSILSNIAQFIFFIVTTRRNGAMERQVKNKNIPTVGGDNSENYDHLQLSSVTKEETSAYATLQHTEQPYYNLRGHGHEIPA